MASELSQEMVYAHIRFKDESPRRRRPRSTELAQATAGEPASGRRAAAFLVTLGVNVERTRLALDDFGTDHHLFDALKTR